MQAQREGTRNPGEGIAKQEYVDMAMKVVQFNSATKSVQNGYKKESTEIDQNIHNNSNTQRSKAKTSTR